MRRSYRSARNEDMCRCCLLPLLTAMGLALYGAIHLVIIVDKFTNRIDRIADKYDNAINATTNSSACQGSLDNVYGRDYCSTNEPCHDYCKNYFDAVEARDGPIGGMVVLFLVFVIGACILFEPGALNVIENFRTFIENIRTFISRCGETRIIRATESINEYTSITTDPRFCMDMGEFNKAHKNQSHFDDDAADSFNDSEAVMELSNMEFTSASDKK